MSELPKYVLDLLRDIATADGLSDYTIELTAGSKHGDHFLGLIHRAILRGQRNGKAAEKRLIIKLSSNSASRREEWQMDTVFEREALVYNKILPLFEKFQCERGLTDAEAFTSYPKCYAAVVDVQKEQFVVIMEDMIEKGFEMWPKHQPIVNNHLFMVVDQLARLHAISFAIKDQQPEVYEEFRKLTDLTRGFFNSDTSSTCRQYLESAQNRAIAALDNENHIEWLKAFKANVYETIDSVLSEDACDGFSVISHGDMWLTNLLFHHDREKMADGVCFLDWQLVRFGSPVIDLYNIIFTSTDKALRDKDYKSLLDHYHHTLTKSIEKLGSSPDLFTRRDFDEQLKKFATWAVFISVHMLPVALADSRDIPDMDDYSANADNDKRADIVPEFDEATQLIYSKRVRGFVGDTYDLGYYLKDN